MVWTGAIMNLCIFGAVAAGPSIGELFAYEKTWHTLFWIVAAIGVLAMVFALLTYEDEDPQDTDAPWDVAAILLALFGCVGAFFGAAELEIHNRATTLGLVCLLGGVALIVVLVVYQYLRKEPLMPVKQIATTFPVVGIVMALTASAAAFGLMDLTLNALAQSSPGHTAVLFLPELGASILTAAFFGALFRTRFTPVYAFTGMLVLCAAAAVLTRVPQGGDAHVWIGAALLGLGVGASVSPGLFIAGFSLESAQIQRVFALIELLRGVGAFLCAPILLYLSATLATRLPDGFRDAAWICFGIAAVGAGLALVLFLLGRTRLQVPDLERWQEEGKPAWDSPPLLDAIRSSQGG
jgi:hypothetical protein